MLMVDASCPASRLSRFVLPGSMIKPSRVVIRKFDGIAFARTHFRGTLIANSGYGDQNKIETARRIIEEGRADLFSFGRLALANPDLPRRLSGAGQAKLNSADPETFYSRGKIGYTDYSALA